MRKLIQKIFRPFFVWLADKFSAAPKQEAVFKSLSRLYKNINTRKSSKGIVLDINVATDSFIIFSDQHKGNKDNADDFKTNEANYIAALNHYYDQGFNYINLGDAEELLKYNVTTVIPKYPDAFKAEANFQPSKKYYRTYGNHDILWKSKIDVMLFLKSAFKMPLEIHEGIVLKTTLNEPLNIFLTHGHQGDKMSDNNIFTTWIIAHIWAPIQRYLEINVNTPSNDSYLRNKHNRLMYEWSSHKRNTILITGHTHKPVFASGKYSNIDGQQVPVPVTKPSYFNTGCCCYNDGDITGIEIDKGYIRLIKWHSKHKTFERMVLEEKKMEEIVKDL